MCWRLWDESAQRGRPAAETPEILRSDLAEPLLALAAMGEQGDFPWLDPPPPEAVENARRLLHLLGAVDESGRVTALGNELARLPAHPRLGRLLLAGAKHGVLREASLVAALTVVATQAMTGRESGGELFVTYAGGWFVLFGAAAGLPTLLRVSSRPFFWTAFAAFGAGGALSGTIFLVLLRTGHLSDSLLLAFGIPLLLPWAAGAGIFIALRRETADRHF